MEIPEHIKRLSFFKIKISLEASRPVWLPHNWHVLPRSAMGNALRREGYNDLYYNWFKPPSIIVDGKETLSPTAFIICPANMHLKKLAAAQRLLLYITVVSANMHLLQRFLNFLPGLQQYNFFKENSLLYKGFQVFNSQNGRFEKYNTEDAEAYKIGFNYIANNKPKWNNFLTLHFQTPAIIRIKATQGESDEGQEDVAPPLTKDIPLDVIVQRLHYRLEQLYRRFFHPDYIADEHPQIPKNQLPLINKIVLPHQQVFKGNKKYNMAGVMGSAVYPCKYNDYLALLFSWGSHLHIGNFTVSGNGSIAVANEEDTLFARFLVKVKIQDAEEKIFAAKGQDIVTQLLYATYIPRPYHRAAIPKDRELRWLNIPDAQDLWLQRLLTGKLSHIAEKFFLPQSYAYRVGKGATQAIAQVVHLRKQLKGSHTFIRFDINDCFDEINHEILVTRIYDFFKEPAIAWLCSLWIKSGIIDKKTAAITPNEKGLPQGAAISPLLANIYLHALDVFIKEEITPHFIRYADDLLLMVPAEKDALQTLQKLKDFLANKLLLHLNKEMKTGSLDDSFSFLGIQFLTSGGLTQSVEKYYKLPFKIKEAIALDTLQFIKLQETITGMKRYYGQVLPADDLMKIDECLQGIYINYLAATEDTELQKKYYAAISKVGFITQKFLKQNWWAKVKLRIQQSRTKPQTTAKALEIQKKKHLKEFASQQELVVTRPGTFIGVNNRNIYTSHKGQKIATIPLLKIKQISIMCDGVTLSSNFNKACHKNNIHVAFYSPTGEIIAFLNSPRQLLPENMLAQAQLPDNKKYQLITKLIFTKINNQLKLIKYYGKYYNRKNADVMQKLQNAIAQLNIILQQTPAEPNIEEQKKALFLWEARAAQQYWAALGVVLTEAGTRFDKREHQGAEDVVNQCLNYGYALLKSRILRLLHTAQLSPNISYLHATKTNEPTLCYDLMEPYRSWVVDRSVIALFTKGEKPLQELLYNHLQLTWTTRKKLITKINERLYAIEPFKGDVLPLYDIMHLLMQQFVNFCTGKQDKIKFYSPKW